MRLQNYYYRILGSESDGGLQAGFRLLLLPGCDVYDGHFPGNPVCPGVFNLQMIKECVESMTGSKLKIDSIRQCRLTSLATPSECPELQLDIKLSAADSSSYQVEARLHAGDKAVMVMNCVMAEAR